MDEGYPTRRISGYPIIGWMWIIQMVLDITPPTVIFNTPATNATNININTSISVTFSENIDPSTVTAAAFVLKDGVGNIIPGTVSYSVGTRSALLLLNSPLDYSTVYTATVSGGSSGIKDLSGNAMVSDYNGVLQRRLYQPFHLTMDPADPY